jgi:hypothetical protein
MKLFTTLGLLAGLATIAAADTIVFKGMPTGVTDGSLYVMPYQLTVDGVTLTVTCYDNYDEVQTGDTWQAQILTIQEAAVSGFFSENDETARYKRIAWLSARNYANSDQQIALQHAIWNVFGSAYETDGSMLYETAADNAAATGYAGFDFSIFRFIQQPGAHAGDPGVRQAFIYTVPLPPSGGFDTPAVPEPAAFWLAGPALIIAGLSRRRR